MNIILFCDTNLLIQISKKLLHNFTDNEVEYYRTLCNTYTCIISSYVIFEIWKTLSKRYGIPVDKIFLIEQLEVLGFCILSSPRGIDIYRYQRYVHDINDAQILLDSITAKANILFTRNIRDFDITKIHQDFDIIVTNTLKDNL